MFGRKKWIGRRTGRNKKRSTVKDYKNAAFLENILIGEDSATVIPKAHAYDDSFTHVVIEWKENHFEVMTAAEGEDLFIIAKCEDKRVKPSTLLIQGLSLYNPILAH